LENEMNDEQIKHMVGRFLAWTLPANFNREEVEPCTYPVGDCVCSAPVEALTKERDEWKSIADLHQATIVEIGAERDAAEAQVTALRRALEGTLKLLADFKVSGPAVKEAEAALAGLGPESSQQPPQELSPGERHELECLRYRVQQLAYPCSPHCDGYLREQALTNTAWKAVRLYTRTTDSGAGAHVIVEAERQDGTTVEVIRSFADITDTIIDHWARLPAAGEPRVADVAIQGAAEARSAPARELYEQVDVLPRAAAPADVGSAQPKS
jgi:hypothetical protein